MGEVVPAHFIEHLLWLQDEVHQIKDLEPMRHHLNFPVFFQLCVVTEVPHKLIWLAIDYDFFQIINVKIYPVFLQIVNKFGFAGWRSYLLLVYYLHQIRVKFISQAYMNDHEALNP